MAENLVGQTYDRAPTTGIRNFMVGVVEFDDTEIVATDYVEIDCGFTPRKVVWSNDTDRVEIVWRYGMADNTCLKTDADGTRTLETTNGGITVTDNGFRVSQNATLGAIKASKVCHWEAIL